MYKKIFLNSLFIFLISTLIHSFYNYLPNFVTSIFFSVNESIWEHMKMIFTSYLLYMSILKLFFNKEENNFYSSYFLASIFNIILFLIIFVPIYNAFGENIIITLVIYFITILISNYIRYLITEKNTYTTLNKYIYIPIIIVYILFTTLTYYPIKKPLFYDVPNNQYGIYTYYD